MVDKMVLVLVRNNLKTSSICTRPKPFRCLKTPGPAEWVVRLWFSLYIYIYIYISTQIVYLLDKQPRRLHPPFSPNGTPTLDIDIVLGELFMATPQRGSTQVVGKPEWASPRRDVYLVALWVNCKERLDLLETDDSLPTYILANFFFSGSQRPTQICWIFSYFRKHSP